ncbi:MAG TPA: TonB-dependent receptor [Pyrinomonadaceae bacterium]|nr:TonB-dependent receptor [Pyrinomonadaceae bacterium]
MPRIPDVSSSAFCPPDKSKSSPVIFSIICFLLFFVVLPSSLTTTYAQSATATLTGTVSDQTGAVLPRVNVSVINIDQGFQRSSTTSDEGVFIVSTLPPGKYTVKAERDGFTTTEIRDVVLNVNAYVELKIFLKVGNLTGQKIDVFENPSLIDQSSSVGGEVNSRLVGMPLNGRSFQSLLTFLPGITLTKANGLEPGQISVNGQRANANSFYIDGVSANISVPTTASPGQSASGSLPGLSASGGTNNLVSIDALQEFRVETSSYAPELGRTPGAQVIIATRPGTNGFHGTLFEYFRNDVLDANDWFANSRGEGRAALRQNDFGGVLGGPVLLPRFGEGGSQPWYNGKDRTFFFFSYEGLRLREPLFGITQVPSLAARQSAPAGIQPFLNAFPRPTGPALANNFAEFASGFSNPSSFDATSLRIDHHVSPNLIVFGRYNHAPSESIQRGILSSSLNTSEILSIKTQTLTGGMTWLLSPATINELRANYSRNGATRTFALDSFGGAVVPADSLLFPSFASSADSNFVLLLAGGRNSALRAGRNLKNLQRQFNIVDSLAVVSRLHQFRFGIDFRRLTPVIGPRIYGQTASFFGGVNAALLGRASSLSVQSQTGPLFPVYLNFSSYAQDNWKVNKRLTLTYGLRYELNPAPTEANGNNPATLIQVDDPQTFALAPSNQSLWKTTYNNFAPRIGMSFQLSQQPGKETVLRGGYGIFYDLGSGVGGQVFFSSFPYIGLRVAFNVPFPLVSPADALPPPVGSLPITQLYAFDHDLKLPYTHQWNFAVEQSLGKNQTVSASYVAALGRRLLRLEQFGGAILARNPLFDPFGALFVTRNAATSDYQALQVRFRRRLTNNLQALSYYTWSHSIDTASNESSEFGPVLFADPSRDRGSSDFDVRHAFNLALTYDLPTPHLNKLGRSILGNWTVDTIVTAHSASPVDVISLRDAGFGSMLLRPDLNPGVPLYLGDPNVGGGKRFNPAAFSDVFEPRQGTLGRNALRGFPLYQTDIGLARRFKATEALSFEFKAEVFNLFNHPSFGDPDNVLSFFGFPNPAFGSSFRMHGKGLGSGGTLGGLNPLYQVGEPRSVQLSLRARF